MNPSQPRVAAWCQEVLGPESSANVEERSVRTAEEAIELTQACGVDAETLHKLVDYVYSRPAGKPAQEIAGTLVTLYSVAAALGVDAERELEKELGRIWQPEVIERCRRRQHEKREALKGNDVHTSPRPPDPIIAGLVSQLLRSPHLKWRHHGIGLLQAYIVEEASAGDVEQRIHVWHPSLRLPDMDDSGLIHDHRFDLESQVLLGTIRDTEIHIDPIAIGSRDPSELFEFFGENAGEFYDVYQIERSKASDDGWVKRANPDNLVYALTRTDHVYAMGSRYRYPKRAFHRTDVDELTVTLVTKRYQSPTPGRLLARIGKTPKHAFGNDPNRYLDTGNDQCRLLLAEAADRLEAIARSPGS